MPLPTLPVLAAITDKLADWATGVVGALGLAGIFVLMTLESTCIPIPSEPTMLSAGFNLEKGTYSLLAVGSVGVAANVLGSWIADGFGRFGQLDLIERRGKLLPTPPGSLEQSLPLRHALALGLMHGPAELLPISSSGHTTLVPWLLGWPYPKLDPALRKSFEVALHAGTAVGLLIALRSEVSEAASSFDRRRAILIAGSFIPPAIVGYTLEGPIEKRLGTPASIAAGLLVGSAAMALADQFGPQQRERDDAGLIDALLLGAAQASALMPGTSRGGMTLSAMRARGFTRPAASALSRHVALPVILGASALKGARLAQQGLPPGAGSRLALGAVAAAASTLLAARLVPVERVGALLPYAAYRSTLAAITLRRLRRSQT